LTRPDIEIPPNAIFIRQDAFKTDKDKLLAEFGGFDLVLSDMAPKTTGIKLTDQTASFELAELAFKIATGVLKQGGNFVCKIFESPEVGRLRKEIMKQFRSVRLFKPKASRSESFEIFLIGISRKSRPRQGAG